MSLRASADGAAMRRVSENQAQYSEHKTSMASVSPKAPPQPKAKIARVQPAPAAPVGAKPAPAAAVVTPQPKPAIAVQPSTATPPVSTGSDQPKR